MFFGMERSGITNYVIAAKAKDSYVVSGRKTGLAPPDDSQPGAVRISDPGPDHWRHRQADRSPMQLPHWPDPRKARQIPKGSPARDSRLLRRGIFKVGWVFTFAAAAYNLVRMRNLGKAAVQSA